MFEGKVLEQSGERLLVESAAAGATLTARTTDQYEKQTGICIAVRPEKIFISEQEPDNDEDTRMQGVIEDFGYFGNLSLYRIRLATGKIVQVSAQNRRRTAERQLEWDDKVFISWRPQSAVILDR
jgi:putrescine transport system ATP-binding protein